MNSKRHNLILILAILAGTSSPLAAQQYWAFGIGGRSCAFWQSDPRLENEALAYIAGMFTGMNMMRSATSTGKGMVGKNTDMAGIVAEVKKLCTAQPSMNLSNAVGEVYATLDERQPK